MCVCLSCLLSFVFRLLIARLRLRPLTKSEHWLDAADAFMPPATPRTHKNTPRLRTNKQRHRSGPAARDRSPPCVCVCVCVYGVQHTQSPVFPIHAATQTHRTRGQRGLHASSPLFSPVQQQTHSLHASSSAANSSTNKGRGGCRREREESAGCAAASYNTYARACTQQTHAQHTFLKEASGRKKCVSWMKKKKK